MYENKTGTDMGMIAKWNYRMMGVPIMTALK
jgi:hypothetical protein